MLSIEQRVDLGIQLLDREAPGWQEKIDLAILDVGSLRDCPMGQVFGSFYEGRRKLDLDDIVGLVEFGFDADVKRDTYQKELDTLNAEWKRRLGDSL